MFLILQMKMPPILKGGSALPPHEEGGARLAFVAQGSAGWDARVFPNYWCRLPISPGLQERSFLSLRREEIQNVGMELTPCPPVRHAPDFKNASLSAFRHFTILTWKGRKKKHLKCFETFLFLGFLFSDHVTS